MEAATCTAEPADRGNRDCDCDQTIGRRKLFASAVHAHDHVLAQCAIPLGLVLSGAIIMDYIRLANWRTSAKPILAAILFRQGFMPLCMLGAASLLSLSLSVKEVVVLQAAMPSAVFPIVLARLYDRDTSTALRVILGTGLFGIITIPLWLYAGSHGCYSSGLQPANNPQI